MTSSLLIVTGPPGAGKSTVCSVLAGQLSRSILVIGDDFFGFLASGGIDPWLPESSDQNEIVIEAAAAATGRFAADYDTIFDGVIGPWHLPMFARATGLLELDYVMLLPPVETCVSRVQARIGHGFTDEASTRKMHAEFTDSTIAERHVIRNGSMGVEEVTTAVLKAQAVGALRYPVTS